ncbi:MAG: nucleoside-diphosphate kinase [Candidatus Komeilibacteria bacterium]|nr:nucleoside-diphosphate kinase [Candidatus Komeilibacteria bacterium]
MERTLIIMKPDTLQRSLVGEIVGRFEKKGLKIAGMKMMELDDLKLEEHYAHHKDKPFFGNLKKFMKSAPVLLMVLEGAEVVQAVRIICGSTKGVEADAGTIRGDLAMTNWNLVHASDSLETAESEIKRFFNNDELFSYAKLGTDMVYESEFKG